MMAVAIALAFGDILEIRRNPWKIMGNYILENPVGTARGALSKFEFARNDTHVVGGFE